MGMVDEDYLFACILWCFPIGVGCYDLLWPRLPLFEIIREFFVDLDALWIVCW